MNSSSVAVSPTPGNILDEFEEAYQNCLAPLIKEDPLTCVDLAELRTNAEANTAHFIEMGRMMQAFFLQKRFQLAAQKPELVILEDVAELRMELTRKDELIKKQSDKLVEWQATLSALQKSPGSTSSKISTSISSKISTTSISSKISTTSISSTLASSSSPSSITTLASNSLAGGSASHGNASSASHGNASSASSLASNVMGVNNMSPRPSMMGQQSPMSIGQSPAQSPMGHMMSPGMSGSHQVGLETGGGRGGSLHMAGAGGGSSPLMTGINSPSSMMNPQQVGNKPQQHGMIK